MERGERHTKDTDLKILPVPLLVFSLGLPLVHGSKQVPSRQVLHTCAEARGIRVWFECLWYHVDMANRAVLLVGVKALKGWKFGGDLVGGGLGVADDPICYLLGDARDVQGAERLEG